MARAVTKYFGWGFNELLGPEGAAFAEEWRYDDAGNLLSRTRTPIGKKGTVTVSTDPRAASIMREEMGRRRKDH